MQLCHKLCGCIVAAGLAVGLTAGVFAADIEPKKPTTKPMLVKIEPVKITGTVEQYNMQPDGRVGSVMLKTDGGMVQLNLANGDAVAKAVAVGGKLSATVHAPLGNPPVNGPKMEHKIMHAISVSDSDGKAIDLASHASSTHINGTIKSLNYDNAGKIDGATLDDGKFVFFGTAASSVLKLATGQKLIADGEQHFNNDGKAMIHAIVLNGMAVPQLHGTLQVRQNPGENRNADRGQRPTRGGGPQMGGPRGGQQNMRGGPQMGGPRGGQQNMRGGPQMGGPRGGQQNMRGGPQMGGPRGGQQDPNQFGPMRGNQNPNGFIYPNNSGPNRNPLSNNQPGRQGPGFAPQRGPMADGPGLGGGYARPDNRRNDAVADGPGLGGGYARPSGPGNGPANMNQPNNPGGPGFGPGRGGFGGGFGGFGPPQGEPRRNPEPTTKPTKPPEGDGKTPKNDRPATN